jgi:hypothetical protein
MGACTFDETKGRIAWSNGGMAPISGVAENEEIIESLFQRKVSYI